MVWSVLRKLMTGKEKKKKKSKGKRKGKERQEKREKKRSKGKRKGKEKKQRSTLCKRQLKNSFWKKWKKICPECFFGVYKYE